VLLYQRFQVLVDGDVFVLVVLGPHGRNEDDILLNVLHLQQAYFFPRPGKFTT
jgi:hypothetical protein